MCMCMCMWVCVVCRVPVSVSVSADRSQPDGNSPIHVRNFNQTPISNLTL